MAKRDETGQDKGAQRPSTANDRASLSQTASSADAAAPAANEATNAAAIDMPKVDAVTADAPKIELPNGEPAKVVSEKQSASEKQAASEKIEPMPAKVDAAADDDIRPSTLAAIAAAHSAPEGDASVRSNRFAVLAASLALAAALGSLAGAVGTSVLSRSPDSAANAPQSAAAEVRALKDTLALVNADLTKLKASMDTANRNVSTQFTRIGERFDRAERAQSEPAARLARIAEAIERLERRNASAAPETTGSVKQQQQPVAEAPAEAKQPPRPGIVSGWVIRDIYGGRALLESRLGLFEVEPGTMVPGVGRVQTIRRQDGRWEVVTPKGIIVSMR